MSRSSLFFFDFDDTLYSHKIKAMPDSTRRALCLLRERGHQVVIASGRGREAFSLFQKELPYMPEVLILMNGQLVYRGDELIMEQHILMDDLDRLFVMAREQKIACGGYYWDGVIADRFNERVETVWRDFGSPFPAICSDFEKKYGIYQAQLYITREESSLFAGEIEKYVTNWSHPYMVNLIHHLAGKSRGVKWCMETFQIPREDTYAFGDGFNDVDLLEAAGHGIAMGNASAVLKEKAEWVTGPAEGSGIWDALHHYGFV